MLRRAIIGYALLAMAGAVLLGLLDVGPPIVLYLGANGTIVLLAILFERGRYRPPTTESGGWQDTAERFIDPSTGQQMMVRYNPRTGARQYVPAPPHKPPPN